MNKFLVRKEASVASGLTKLVGKTNKSKVPYSELRTLANIRKQRRLLQENPVEYARILQEWSPGSRNMY